MRSLKICCSLFLFFQGFSADCFNPEALQGTYSISDNGSGVRFVGDNFWFSFHPDLNNFVKPLLVKVDFQDNHLRFYCHNLLDYLVLLVYSLCLCHY